MKAARTTTHADIDDDKGRCAMLQMDSPGGESATFPSDYFSRLHQRLTKSQRSLRRGGWNVEIALPFIGLQPDISIQIVIRKGSLHIFHPL